LIFEKPIGAFKVPAFSIITSLKTHTYTHICLHTHTTRTYIHT